MDADDVHRRAHRKEDSSANRFKEEEIATSLLIAVSGGGDGRNERLTACDHLVSKNATPTMVNSMGIKKRRMWKKILRTGHSLVRKRRHARGDNTRVSQAATVSVHTKKYFCAERWGGRLRESGRIEDGSAMARREGWWWSKGKTGAKRLIRAQRDDG